jgi:hypothetical protein
MRRRLLLSTVIYGMAALALWACAAATTWLNFLAGRGLTIECVGAGVLTLLADRRWSERCNRDHAMLYLVDRAVASRRAAETEEVPLRAAAHAR